MPTNDIDAIVEEAMGEIKSCPYCMARLAENDIILLHISSAVRAACKKARAIKYTEKDARELTTNILTDFACHDFFGANMDDEGDFHAVAELLESDIMNHLYYFAARNSAPEGKPQKGDSK